MKRLEFISDCVFVRSTQVEQLAREGRQLSPDREAHGIHLVSELPEIGQWLASVSQPTRQPGCTGRCPKASPR